jgi:hypothetical protein
VKNELNCDKLMELKVFKDLYIEKYKLQVSQALSKYKADFLSKAFRFYLHTNKAHTFVNGNFEPVLDTNEDYPYSNKQHIETCIVVPKTKDAEIERISSIDDFKLKYYIFVAKNTTFEDIYNDLLNARQTSKRRRFNQI